MAPPAPVAAAADGQVQSGGQQQQQGGGFGQSIGGIIRMAVIWYFASKFFSSSSRKPSDPSLLTSNIFPKAELMDMWFYVSEHDTFDDFGNESALVWHETNIPYAVYGPESTRTLSVMYYPSEALQHNGTLYGHVYFARAGYPVDPKEPEYLPLAAFGRTHPIVVNLPKSKAGKKRSLLGDSKDSVEDVKISEACIF